MTKQEIIKKAYGEYWDKVKDHVDEDGWIHFLPHGMESFMYKKGGESKYRPKGIKGIEHNNGWINVDDELKMPVNDATYLACDQWGYMSVCGYDSQIGWYPKIDGNHPNFNSDNITHYRQLPKPPIY